jgi:hypothetical protein
MTNQSEIQMRQKEAKVLDWTAGALETLALGSSPEQRDCLYAQATKLRQDATEYILGAYETH